LRAKKLSKRPTTQVLFELHVWQLKRDEQHMEIWQLPSSLTPNLAQSFCLARLGGRCLRYFESQLRRIWAADYIEIDPLPLGGHAAFSLSEETALHLGLVFRVLSPMKDRDAIRQCLQGIEAMSLQERAYWIGMAIHRPKPRRVLKALRVLLTEAG
jgi:hypothetical protein